LIFDCDGTLVDSMPLHMKAWTIALEKFGLVYDYEFFYSRRGMSEEEIIHQFKQKVNSQVESEKIVSAKHEYYYSHLNSVKPIKIVVDIVLAYKNKLPMAVVTGGTKENVLASLKVIGIDNYFKILVTSDNNLRPKPAPDLFLEAAKILDVEPEYCQVFEDGPLGIEAANRAGMIAIDVIPYIQR
jgi:HAD superfamily hydrolase (TIGR01509 family)